MRQRNRLSRQIVLSMGLVALITTLIVFVGSFVIYGVLYTFFLPPPSSAPQDMLIPQAPDYLIFAALLLAALIVAIIIALRLARRILAPLNSLAESARRIATGDLAARAIPGDRSLGETAHLVDDFNTMAMKLQGMAADMAAWNAAIAHELRTPLTILKGRLQGLRDGVFVPNEALFHSLLFQVEGLSRLVEDLRVVTLQDSGRLQMRIEPTEIGAEVERALDSIRPALEEAGIRTELQIVPVIVHCDGPRIRQALLALLDNVRRYAAPGRLRIEVEPLDTRVVLRVEDEGPGLTAEFARHAFDPFTRDDASRSRESGGSGLGLSVVRAIAKAHGGDVSYAQSSVGGSIFEIDIPRTTAADR